MPDAEKCLGIVNFSCWNKYFVIVRECQTILSVRTVVIGFRYLIMIFLIFCKRSRKFKFICMYLILWILKTGRSIPLIWKIKHGSQNEAAQAYEVHYSPYRCTQFEEKSVLTAVLALHYRLRFSDSGNCRAELPVSRFYKCQIFCLK